MKKRITIVVALMLFAVLGYAQTVKWLVVPQYDSITHYSDNIFKCIDQNGRIQLLDWNGKSIGIPEDADAITDYSDGYAIVLQGDRILGILAETNRQYQRLDGDYYATKYSFFSEGYIAVAKGSVEGKQGYLDAKGKPVHEFKYLEAMPVHKGWALVVENGKDKVKPRRYKRSDDWSGDGMPALKTGESFVWATTFNADGLALTKIKGGKFVVIDSNFNEIERRDKGNKEEVNTFDYSYKPAGSQEVKFTHNAQPDKNNDCSLYDKDGKKGYKTSDGVFVPAQFSDAKDFYARRAIVSMGNGYGIIEWLDGKFKPSWPEESVRVYEYAKKVELLQFALSAPASLESNKLKLEFDKGDGHFVECKELCCDNFKLADRVISSKSLECTLHAKVTYSENNLPDLLLWEEESKPIKIDYINISLSAPSVTSEYADENDNQTVKAVVTNTSDVAVTVSVKLTVDGKTVPFKGKLSSKQSKTLTATVKVDEDNKQVQAVISAEVDGHNCGSKSAYVSLKKI